MRSVLELSTLLYDFLHPWTGEGKQDYYALHFNGESTSWHRDQASQQTSSSTTSSHYQELLILSTSTFFLCSFSVCVFLNLFLYVRFTISVVNVYHRCMKILCRIERRHNICGLIDKYTVSCKHVNRREYSTKRSRWISRGLTHHGFICLIEHITSAQFLFVLIFYKLLQLSLRGSVIECSY